MRKISFFLVGVFLLLLSGNLFAQSPARGEEGYQWDDPIISGVKYTITSTSPAEVSITITAEVSTVDFIPTTVEDNGITYDVVEIASIGDNIRYLEVPESIRKIDCPLYMLNAIKFECTNLPELVEDALATYSIMVVSVPEGRKAYYQSAIEENITDGYANFPRMMEGGVPYTEDGSGIAFLWDREVNGNYYASAVGVDPDMTEAIIPQTITGLGTDRQQEYSVVKLDVSAFESHRNIKRVVLPETINYIGSNAFYDCRNLKYINIPYQVTGYGSYCFEEMHADTLCFAGQYAGNEDAFLSTEVKNLILPASRRSLIFSLTLEGGLVYDTVTVEGAWNYYTFENNSCPPRHAVVFKNNAYFYNGSTFEYQEAPHFWENKPVYVEKDLAIDEFSLIGNIGGATNYNFIASNIGDNSGFAHSMVALPFYYAGNSWGVDGSGSGAINGTHTPVSYGESFFVYPTTNQYNTDATTIAGDTYTTLRQEIPYTNLKLDNFTVSLTNNNTTKWFALSNPFIGKLNLSKFYTSNSAALQGTYAYVWDNTEHDWLALDDISTANKYALYPATGILIEGASANPTFNFKVDDVVKNETITTTKSAQANRVEFTALSNNVEMKMYAHIDDVSSNGYGRMDASVLFSNKEDAVNPYFALEGRNIFDNYFSELPATFDVNFNAYKSNAIDFALTSSMEGIEVTLIDLANENAETVLNVNEPVSIDVTAGQNEGRYQLRFSKKNVGINEVASQENAIQIWNNNREVTINGKDLKRVEIFNTLGQRVYSSSLSGESTAFDSKLNDGAYIVKVYTANSSKSEKIIIR